MYTGVGDICYSNKRITLTKQTAPHIDPNFASYRDIGDWLTAYTSRRVFWIYYTSSVFLSSVARDGDCLSGNCPVSKEVFLQKTIQALISRFYTLVNLF